AARAGRRLRRMRAAAATTSACMRPIPCRPSPSSARRAERRNLVKEIQMRYNARHFDLSGLKGISDATLEQHFKLYEGYVAQTNGLIPKLPDPNNNGAGATHS